MLHRLFQEKSEDKNDDKFQDQGDLFTIKLPAREKIQWEDFSNLILDELSLFVIYKGINNVLKKENLGKSVRYAASIFIHTESDAVVNYLASLPSLPSNSNEDDFYESQKHFGKGFVIKARSYQARGLVHADIKKFFTQGKSIVPFKTSRTLGLSFTIKASDSKDKNKGVIMTLVGRSSDQLFMFKLNPVAENCFLFDDYEMDKNGLVKEEIDTTVSDIKRSIPSQAMTRLACAISKKLGEQKGRFVCPVKVKIENIDFGMKYNEKWNQLRNNKKGIAEHLEHTIYVVCGSKEQCLIEKKDVKVISDILEQAKVLGIQLDLNKIPTRYQKNKKALPALVLAIKKVILILLKFLLRMAQKQLQKTICH